MANLTGRAQHRTHIVVRARMFYAQISPARLKQLETAGLKVSLETVREPEGGVGGAVAAAEAVVGRRQHACWYR